MLFDSNNNIFDTSKFEYLDEGSCAVLSHQNNVVMKTYKTECKPIYYFSKKTFDRLKQLDLNSIVKLYNYYYFDIESYLKFIFPPSVYTMEYVHNPNINVLEQSKEYLLDVVSKLEKDIDILSYNKIKIFDAHYSNIIFKENNAVIIDIDLFRTSLLMAYKKILLHNKKQLLDYIVSTLRHELEEQNLYNIKFENLFKIYNMEKTTVTDFFNKSLEDNKIKNCILSKI